MKTEDSQVNVLHTYLMFGCKINRVEAFRFFGIADLRSRVSDLERRFNIRLERCKVDGKRYYQYWISNDKKLSV